MFVLEQLAAIGAILAGFALYLAPAWVAFIRRHPQRIAILVLNLLGGWTVIGWVVAIVWAFTVTAEE